MSGSGVDRFIGGQGQGVNTVGGSGADVRTGALKSFKDGKNHRRTGSRIVRVRGGQIHRWTGQAQGVDTRQGQRNEKYNWASYCTYSMYNVQLYILYMYE